jgi:hypothetical protein
MSAAELKPDHEEVFTVTEYYDGPRQGVANFKGQPHFYDCVFDEGRNDYSNLFALTPVSAHIFDLAREDWAIWERWEAAFYAGNTTRESHPALPQDRVRHEEIRAILGSALKTNKETCTVQAGLFEVLGSPTLPKGVIRPLKVKWTEP